MTALALMPLSLEEANTFVVANHRHHKPVVGHMFSLGAAKDDAVVGVAIVGRPVSRMRDDGATLEVTRLCTDGTRNACSFLYGAAARAAFALGYRRIGTYTLIEEGGASLRGAGWKLLRPNRRLPSVRIAPWKAGAISAPSARFPPNPATNAAPTSSAPTRLAGRRLAPTCKARSRLRRLRLAGALHCKSTARRKPGRMREGRDCEQHRV